MDKVDGLPFEVGQLCEARSFQHGFRSAWFRCKIKQIGQKNGYTCHLLEYFDFPDEKESWTKLYQLPQKKSKPNRELMVRPQYPPICLEDHIPLVTSISVVTVVITGSWNVGDLVDWWTDDCYWSGKITKVLGDGKAQMEFPPPPVGEGSSYEVSFEDLRPSLDWSPKYGWRVPTSVVGGKRHQCARLIHPVNQDQNAAGGYSTGFQLPSVRMASDGHVADGLPSTATLSSHVPMKSLAASDKTSGSSEKLEEPSILTGKTGRNMNLVREDNCSEKTICEENNSSLNVRGGSDEALGNVVEKDLSNSSRPLKKLRAGGNSLNSFHSETLEAAVVDLEELANKIRWLKGLLGVRIPLSNAVEHSWRFVEHRAPSMPK